MKMVDLSKKQVLEEVAEGADEAEEPQDRVLEGGDNLLEAAAAARRKTRSAWCPTARKNVPTRKCGAPDMLALGPASAFNARTRARKP